MGEKNSGRQKIILFGWEEKMKEYKKIVCINLLSCLFDTKKLSLPDNALDEKVIGDEKYKDAKVTQDDDEVKDIGGLKQGGNTLH